MTPQEHAQAAARLIEAEQTGQQIGLLSRGHPEISMDDELDKPQRPTTETMRRIARNVLGREVEVTDAQTQRQADGWRGEPHSPVGSIEWKGRQSLDSTWMAQIKS